MDRDRQNLDEQIEHHQEMLRILRRRLRVQERKEAEYGIAVPAEIATEILTLNERIGKHEAEEARLQTLAAEGKEPLAEVEYRALLAEAWDTPKGRPSVAGAAKLELARLRLGIALDKAEELEYQVRVALAQEVLSDIGHICVVDKRIEEGDTRFLTCKRELPVELLTDDQVLRIIGRAVQLEVDTAVHLLVAMLPQGAEIDAIGLSEQLIKATGEARNFVAFSDLLSVALIHSAGDTAAIIGGAQYGWEQHS